MQDVIFNHSTTVFAMPMLCLWTQNSHSQDACQKSKFIWANLGKFGHLWALAWLVSRLKYGYNLAFFLLGVNDESSVKKPTRIPTIKYR